MILNSFSDWMNKTISVYPKKTGLDGGRPAQGFEITPTLTGVKCAFYEGSAAESLVSDRYKTKIDGVCVAYPGITVPDGAKIAFNDGKVYYVVHADDVLSLGEALIIAVSQEE